MFFGLACACTLTAAARTAYLRAQVKGANVNIHKPVIAAAGKHQQTLALQTLVDRDGPAAHFECLCKWE